MPDHIPILAVAQERQFLKMMRSLLVNEGALKIISMAKSEELALLSIKYCTIALLDADSYPSQQLHDIARSLRTRNSNVKLIIVSRNDLSCSLLSYLSVGVMGFYCQNEPAERLIQIIHGANEGRTFIPERDVSELIDHLRQLCTKYKACSQSIKGSSNEAFLLLTLREQEVFDLLGKGFDNAQISAQLDIEYGTVKNHVHKVLKKLGVKNRSEAASLHNMFQSRATMNVSLSDQW